MNSPFKSISLAFLFIISFAVFADDNPEDVIGSQKFDSARCINDNVQTCLNSICINSEEIDCEDNCKKTAAEQCQEQINE
jgi:hypothetical protein